jgi:Phosphotransferase enzyme family
VNYDEITISSQNPRIFRIDHPGFSFPIAVKHVREKTGSAALQLEALKRVSRALGEDGRFRVPHPVGVDESSGALLMEWVDLPSLESRLKDWRTPADCALMFVADSGQWLRRLHDARHLPDGLVESERLLEALANALRDVPGLQGKGMLSRFVDTLRRTAAPMSKVSVPRGLQHGDYKPANVLCGPRSTIGIDCHAIHEGLVIVDVGHFMNHLDFTLLTPQGLPFLPWRKRFASSFLRGYAGPEVAIESAVPPLPLAWSRLHAVTRFWISEARLGSSFLRSRYRCWCYRHLGKILDRELSPFVQ